MISELSHANLRNTLGNICLGNCGLTANGANAATGTAVAYTLNGKFASLGITATISAGAVYNVKDMALAASKGLAVPSKVAAPVNPGCARVYAVAVNAGGVKIFEGDNVTATTNSREAPAIPANMTAIGVILIEVGTLSGATAFQLGTTALATNAGTRVTVTFSNVSTLWPTY